MAKGLINNYHVFNDGKYFGKNGRQNYLVFQPFSRLVTAAGFEPTTT